VILYLRARTLAVCSAHFPLDGASDDGVSEAIYLRDPGTTTALALLDRCADCGCAGPTGVAMHKRRFVGNCSRMVQAK